MLSGSIMNRFVWFVWFGLTLDIITIARSRPQHTSQHDVGADVLAHAMSASKPGNTNGDGSVSGYFDTDSSFISCVQACTDQGDMSMNHIYFCHRSCINDPYSYHKDDNHNNHHNGGSTGSTGNGDGGGSGGSGVVDDSSRDTSSGSSNSGAGSSNGADGQIVDTNNNNTLTGTTNNLTVNNNNTNYQLLTTTKKTAAADTTTTNNIKTTTTTTITTTTVKDRQSGRGRSGNGSGNAKNRSRGGGGVVGHSSDISTNNGDVSTYGKHGGAVRDIDSTGDDGMTSPATQPTDRFVHIGPAIIG